MLIREWNTKKGIPHKTKSAFFISGTLFSSNENFMWFVIQSQFGPIIDLIHKAVEIGENIIW